MNKEELIGKLHMIYAGDRNALDEMIGYYDGLKEVVELLKKENQELKADYGNKAQVERDLLQQENKQLKDNWNKLKEYINIMHEYYLYTDVNVIYRNNSIKNEKLGYPILCNLSELLSSDRVLSSIYKKMQELEKVDNDD